ncbi:MAG: extracellular solute-binding protein [Anaerolinea sp.]|nr:extracellular solute-binding protein [Anaerolinea sp.]
MFKNAVRILLLCAVFMLISSVAFAQEPVTIRIFVGLGGGTGENEVAAQQALAEAWNAEHPDIQIVFDVYNPGQARDVLLTQIAGGNAPDIVGPVGIEGIYQNAQLWRSVADLIERDAAELALDDFDPAIVNLYEGAGGVNYSLPLGVFPTVMFVNEDIFAAAEVPLPPTEWGAPYVNRDGEEMPWDWDTVAEVMRQITYDANGVYADEEGFDAENPDTAGWAAWWYGNGRKLAMAFGAQDSGVAADGMTATFNQPGFLNAYTWVHDRLFVDFTSTYAAQSAVVQAAGTTPFESGKIGMWTANVWYTCCTYADNSDSALRFNWNVYPSPAVPGTNGEQIVSPLDADTYVMTAATQHPEEAWQVMKYLLSADANMCSIFGCVPARSTARASWETNITSRFANLNLDVVYGGLAYPDQPSAQAALPNQAQANDAINRFFRRLQDEPEFNVEAELNALNETIQGIYEGEFPPTPTPSS